MDRVFRTGFASAWLLGTAIGGVSGCSAGAQQGAAVGAAGGAAVGGAIGAAKGSTAKGAIIGAAIGGAAGSIIGDQMDRQAREIVENVKGARVERVGEGIAVTFESGLLYDFDSDAVRAEARGNLRELAKSLEQYPKSNVLILGHTDDVGGSAYNRGLSQRRADSAAAYLSSQGVERRRIEARGLGESEPVESNEEEEGRARNRRVEVAIFASEEYRQEARRQAGGG
jgi:outer membrane protein OmpA-like peptidoglycan-associated protein